MIKATADKEKKLQARKPGGQYLLLHDYEKNRNCILKNELDLLDFKNGSSNFIK